MPAFEVLFKVSRLSESLSALLTRIRFVAGVRAAVHGEATRTQERFTAQAAEKLLLADFLLWTLFFVVDKPDKYNNRQHIRVKLWVRVAAHGEKSQVRRV